jgi:hypothetical protein
VRKFAEHAVCVSDLPEWFIRGFILTWGQADFILDAMHICHRHGACMHALL